MCVSNWPDFTAGKNFFSKKEQWVCENGSSLLYKIGLLIFLLYSEWTVQKLHCNINSNNKNFKK